MNPDHKQILKIARKNLDKAKYTRLKKLGKDDIPRAAQYSVISNLEKIHSELTAKAKNMEEDNIDVFFVKNKLILFPSKIMHLQHNFTMEEYNKVNALIKCIRRELDA